MNKRMDNKLIEEKITNSSVGFISEQGEKKTFLNLFEKIRILEMDYKASGKRLILEEPEPDLSAYDWSNNGTEYWPNASITKMVAYVRAVDQGKEFTKNAMYVPMMTWWSEHDDQDTRNSLLLWVGGEKNIYYGLKTILDKLDPETRESLSLTETDPTINPLKKLGDDFLIKVNNEIKATTPEDGQAKSQLILISKILTESSENGIYLNSVGMSKVKTFMVNILKPIYWKTNGGYTLADVNLLKSNLVTFQAYFQTGTGGFVDVEQTNENLKIEMSDDIKLKLLSSLSYQVDNKIKNNTSGDGVFGSDISTVVSKADTLIVTKDSSKLSVGGKSTTSSTGKVLQTISFHYALPDLDLPQEDRNIDSQSLFKDDLVNLNNYVYDDLDAITLGLRKKIRELKGKNDENEITVQLFEISAFASTSCVNSSYVGGVFDPKATKNFNQINNKTLAKDRLTNMVNAMTTSLEDEFKEMEDVDGTIISKLKTGTLLNCANVGPEWEFMGFGNVTNEGSVSQKGEGLTMYGPMYQEAYKNNNNLTPQSFYRKRKDDPLLKSDYELTYGNYRVATVSIKMEVLANQDLIDIVADGEYATTITGQYAAEITWDVKSKDDRGSGGGGSKRGKLTRFPPMPKFVGRTLNCPDF